MHLNSVPSGFGLRFTKLMFGRPPVLLFMEMDDVLAIDYICK